MKKILLLFVIVSMFTSCQKETSTDTKWDVINFGIRQADWSLNVDDKGLNPCYSCLINMPEITSYIYWQGVVQLYYVMDGTQQVLPYVRHYEDGLGNMWTQTIDADFSAGTIKVYVTDSDFSEIVPPAMDFRVVLLW